MLKAMRQMPGQPGRVGVVHGEAVRDPTSDEACDQLTVRRGRRTFVPAHVHAPAQRIHHLGLIAVYFELGKGSTWPAFVYHPLGECAKSSQTRACTRLAGYCVGGTAVFRINFASSA